MPKPWTSAIPVSAASVRKKRSFSPKAENAPAAIGCRGVGMSFLNQAAGASVASGAAVSSAAVVSVVVSAVVVPSSSAMLGVTPV